MSTRAKLPARVASAALLDANRAYRTASTKRAPRRSLCCELAKVAQSGPPPTVSVPVGRSLSTASNRAPAPVGVTAMPRLERPRPPRGRDRQILRARHNRGRPTDDRQLARALTPRLPRGLTEERRSAANRSGRFRSAPRKRQAGPPTPRPAWRSPSAARWRECDRSQLRQHRSREIHRDTTWRSSEPVDALKLAV